MLHSQPLSLVVNLAGLTHAGKVAYVEQALAGLEATRARTGLHWILLDEAHYFRHEGAPGVARLHSPTGAFLLVTYRPSLVAAAVIARMGAYLLRQTTVEEERYFFTGLLQASGPPGLAAHMPWRRSCRRTRPCS